MVWPVVLGGVALVVVVGFWWPVVVEWVRRVRVVVVWVLVVGNNNKAIINASDKSRKK